MYDDNTKFIETAEMLLAQLPRPGDTLEVLRPHSQPVFALAAGRRLGGRGPLLVSGSWDGSTAEFGRGGAAGFERPAQRGSAVLSATVLEGHGLVAAGMQDGVVVVWPCSGSAERGSLAEGSSSRPPPARLTGHGGSVLSLAWLASRRWLACGGPAGVVIWELKGASLAEREEGVQFGWALRWRLGQDDGAVRGLCWTHAAGRPWLACATMDGGTFIWDIGLHTMDVSDTG